VVAVMCYRHGCGRTAVVVVSAAARDAGPSVVLLPMCWGCCRSAHRRAPGL